MVQWAAGVPVPERATSVWNLPELSAIEIVARHHRNRRRRHPRLPARLQIKSTAICPRSSRPPPPSAPRRSRPAAPSAAMPPTPPRPAIPRPPCSSPAAPSCSPPSPASREVPLAKFWTAYRKIDARPDEIILAFRLPKRGQAVERFRKIGTRQAQAISKVMAASRILVEKGRIDSAAIALGSIAPTPVRLAAVEAFLVGKKLHPRPSIDRGGSAGPSHRHSPSPTSAPPPNIAAGPPDASSAMPSNTCKPPPVFHFVP